MHGNLMSTLDQPLQRCRVLVVEDEYFIACDLCRAVRAAGGEVAGPVARCADGMRLLEEEGVDGAIVDVHLGIDGLAYPLVDELLRASVPVVFATGIPGADIDPRYADIPIWVKPFLSDMVVSGLYGLCR